MRPYLLVDVDGVLNPEVSNSRFRKLSREGWVQRHGWSEGIRYRLRLNPAHGPKLVALAEETGAELAWATTWEDAANTYVGPHVGLPRLPVAPARRYAKHETVVPWTAGRPFVWLDDEPYIADYCAELAQPNLVVTPDEYAGLTDDDLELARKWLLELK